MVDLILAMLVDLIAGMTMFRLCGGKREVGGGGEGGGGERERERDRQTNRQTEHYVSETGAALQYYGEREREREREATLLRNDAMYTL